MKTMVGPNAKNTVTESSSVRYNGCTRTACKNILVPSHLNGEGGTETKLDIWNLPDWGRERREEWVAEM